VSTHRAFPFAFTLIVTVVLTFAVIAHGWVSDDAAITLRYASNLVNGHGPVFNLGERVQGYTHPLWFLLLAGVLVVEANPLYAAVILGALFTALTAVVLAWTLFQRAADPVTANVLVVGLALVFLSSESWLSFQTSGLENSLSHFLIVLVLIQITRSDGPRLSVVALLCGLLFLTRPDFAVLVAPLALLVAFGSLKARQVAPLALAAIPVVAWEVFALNYYGALLPNSATAKVGIYPSLADSAQQGLRYLWDWAEHEPLSAAVAALLLVAGLGVARSRYTVAWAAGLGLYLAAVVLGGGDFMRGRLLLPLFSGASVYGALALATPLSRPHDSDGRPAHYALLRSALPASLAALAATALVWRLLLATPDAAVSAAGIVDERMWYSGYQLSAYRINSRLTDPHGDIDTVAALRAYAAACGPVTVHSQTPGMLGVLAGPSVTVIDTLGLTDRYIARLPRQTLVSKTPRPGHAVKNIPVSYLAERRDIAILDGSWEAVLGADCDFGAKTARYLDSDLPFHPPMELPP